ncbi:hypothetical protein [Methanobrevibacter arboriphilus]|uniref:hypothetical protein n=1 Tax=Methanobrevibacter arboriphilus TaxID=39441 RepID=UPI0005B28AD2|nr:hypothetical protein [Methanobrevibacter arboriphilus]
MPYIDIIEWEYLQYKRKFFINLGNFSISKATYEIPNIEEITIERNEKYEIIGFITGKFENKEEFEVINEMYNFKKTINYELHDNYEKILIKNCIIRKIDFEKDEYNINFRVANIQRIIKNSDENLIIKEWFINGPKNKFLFHRGTEYEKIVEYKKSRKSGQFPNHNRKPLEKDLSIKINEKSTSYRNYNYIEPKNLQNFIIELVPNKYEPKWSRSIGIEYHTPDDINANIREKVSEIVSFYFGRQLIKIGETYYNEKNEIIKEISYNPYVITQDLIKLCELSDMPLVDYDYYRDGNKIEEDISFLVDSYLSKSEELDFSNFFQYYWLSFSLPHQAQIIILSSSLESMKKSWYDSMKSKTKGIYLPKNQYNSIVKDELVSLEEKLKDYPKIFSKIKYAYQMGSKDALLNFFDEIELKIGDLEKKSLEIRHKTAHGSKIKEEDFSEIYFFVIISKTLINRVILKILDYGGYYKDQFSFENKHIDSPVEKINKEKFDKNYSTRYEDEETYQKVLEIIDKTFIEKQKLN